jgi:hydroxyacylglutathione hydrolase
MQLTNHFQALKLPFQITIGPDKKLDRFVYVYLIFGKKICLIDSGVAGCEKLIFDYLKKAGRISWI